MTVANIDRVFTMPNYVYGFVLQWSSVQCVNCFLGVLCFNKSGSSSNPGHKLIGRIWTWSLGFVLVFFPSKVVPLAVTLYYILSIGKQNSYKISKIYSLHS